MLYKIEHLTPGNRALRQHFAAPDSADTGKRQGPGEDLSGSSHFLAFLQPKSLTEVID